MNAFLNDSFKLVGRLHLLCTFCLLLRVVTSDIFTE